MKSPALSTPLKSSKGSEMFKVTFSNKGYVAGVFFNQTKSAEAAIDLAKLSQVGLYDSAHAEDMDSDDDPDDWYSDQLYD